MRISRIFRQLVCPQVLKLTQFLAGKWFKACVLVRITYKTDHDQTYS